MTSGGNVLIVGGGPTGLTLAIALARAGVGCTVLESAITLPRDMRASSLHPPTLEMLASLGLEDDIIPRGIKVPTWQIRDRTAGIVAEFDMSLLREDTPYPFRFQFEQHRLTPLLMTKAEQSDLVDLRRGARVERVKDEGPYVLTRLTNGETIRSDFVIGCDGARSAVRSSLNIAFEGFTWPERFIIASIGDDLASLGFSGAAYIADPDHWAAILHVADTGLPGLWRVSYPAEEGQSDEQAASSEAVQGRLRAILPDCGILQFDVRHVGIFRVHQRVAETFAKGRVTLVGDAAHLNNPLGGLGLNGGIHDAINLAEKLTCIRAGADHHELFARYDRQRRPINIKAVQKMSIRNKQLLEQRDPAARTAALNEIRATAQDPARAKAFLLENSLIQSLREASAIS